jgi:hypothetical protein
MEGHAYFQCDAGELEQLPPDVAGEDGALSVTMDSDNPWRCTMSWKNTWATDCIRVTERDEVCILGEAVDHHQDDTLAMNLGQCLHKIHEDIHPDM